MSAAIGTNSNHRHFTRRVSFNNLNPDYIDDIHLPPVSGKSSVSYEQDPNFGYGAAVFKDITKLYNTTSLSGVSHFKKKHKLPDPPSKSILKNRSPATGDAVLNDLEGINYHEVPDLDSDSASEGEEPSPRLSSSHLQPHAQPRRKSYSEMTDEELIALDPQFSTTRSKTSNMSQFKFDSQSAYYSSGNKRLSVAAINNARNVYPSSNENNYNSITLTVKHEGYDDVEIKRTILTVISGRRHSWSSLDWLLDRGESAGTLKFLENGDHLVVASYIPSKYWRNSDSCKKDLDDFLYRKCDNILNYVIESLPAGLKVKITIELVSDRNASELSGRKLLMGNKFMLSHLYKQYLPTLIVMGNKSSNLNFKYPKKLKTNQNDKDEYIIKISSYIIKYSTIPVILVGSSLQNDAIRRTSNVTIAFNSNHSSYKGDHSTSSSNQSIELLNENGRSALAKQIENLASSEDEERFEKMLQIISDTSLHDSNKYLEAIKSNDDHMKIDSRIHTIYRSQTNNSSRNRRGSNGDSIYKVKSLISYDEDDEEKNRKKRIEKKKLIDKKGDGNGLKGKKKSFWKKLGLSKS
ncbi:uncharacterized protein PRCAT00000354001 [Priceomyces carsonii]|uniref:uncharacterized protein n=1 Tax=Priceomyces carsonii TaxID=28549 RepID=UPI002ED7E97D|nr:unnamed protein product [Priceomyces carsonii]